MLRSLREKISLNNLKDNSGGQIATLLILIMMAFLIFILVTVNLGKVSSVATNLSNAADAGSLYLASQLATRANMYYETLGGRTKKCEKVGGMLGTILAVVVAITAIVVAAVLAAPTGGGSIWAAVQGLGTVTATLAGAAGGAIGGGVGSKASGAPGGFWSGALQGAIIGGTIGYGVGRIPTSVAEGGVVEEGGLVAGSGGATIETADGLFSLPLDAGAPIFQGEVILEGTAVPALGTVISGVATTPLMILGGGVVDQYLSDRAGARFFKQAVNGLNGLPEEERIREGVFLQVFSQTIDDPNKTTPDFCADCNGDGFEECGGDPCDSDGDGDKKETIPYFQYWWEQRFQHLKGKFQFVKEYVTVFVNGPLTDFGRLAEEEYSDGPLLREEGGASGLIPALAGALEAAGQEVSFWQPGVPPPDVPVDPNCEECSPLPEEYLDEVDRVASELKEIAEVANKLKGQGIEQVAGSYGSWMGLFYYPQSYDYQYYDQIGEDVTYDNKLYNIIVGERNGTFKGLDAWKNEIIEIRQSLPVCTLGAGSGLVSNPPCQLEGTPDYPFAATIDSNINDEFSPAIKAIDDLIAGIEAFRLALANLYNDIHGLATEPLRDWGGRNPATYKWTDSTGGHSITVAISPFKTASIKERKAGNFLIRKRCLDLKDYSDSGENTWVEVTREDPASKEVGKLSRWNPFLSGTTKKKSKAYYSFDNVGIANIK